MSEKRPRSREKHEVSGGGNVNRRGSGLGTGPVGSQDGYSGRGSGSGGGGGKRAARRISLPMVLLILAYLFFSGRGSSQEQTNSGLGSTGSNTGTTGAAVTGQQSFSSESNAYYKVDTSVASGSRAKRTVIKGDGTDVVTIMVYMCGTDLESKSGMASNDLAEMAAATLGDNVNLLVYTGGCTAWKTNGISNNGNQIYQVKDGNLKRLVDDDGARVMTDPGTLSGFIRWCDENYPANRYELIFWDHGGGSVSGFGYDEKNKGSGSMSLGKIKRALEDGGVTFDFIGFDACLMATAETALMLDDFGDYLLASEETEPGIGWYYTNWLTKLGSDPAMSTLDVGKNIIDDYTNACAARCRGQKTTLSLIDLAEFSNTVPDKLTGFSRSVNTMIANDEYKEVSDARYETREFAASSKIDQVDLVHLAENMNTGEGRTLAEALRSAVKYNRTSDNMTNANGVSIYFPYKRTSYVDKACDTYEDIGMDDEYTKCIREFAGMEASGQIAAGGTASPISALLGNVASGGVSGDVQALQEMIGDFLTSRKTMGDFNVSDMAFYLKRGMSEEQTSEYISVNHLDADNLFWSKAEDDSFVLQLSESQWALVHDIDMNMFYDDGEGYVDLGLDNMFRYDDDGNLIADTSGTWLSINGQIIPYYHIDTTEAADDVYTITGRVPVLLNGERANLILVFNDDHPYGFIAGAVTDYVEGETETVAKSMTELQDGDTLDFVCDYYSYDGTYQDSYVLGERMTYSDDMVIGDAAVGAGAKRVTYRLTDIYNQEYWTPVVE